MYIPPGFDSDQLVKRWFIYDLNVIGRLKEEELLAIPYMVFLASQQNDKWYNTKIPYLKIYSLESIGFLFPEKIRLKAQNTDVNHTSRVEEGNKIL